MKSLRSFFIAANIGITLVVFAALIGYNLFQFDHIISDEVKNELKTQVEKEATAFNSRLIEIGRQNLLSAKNIESMPKYDTNVILNTDKSYIKFDTMIIGAGFWMEPGKFDPGQRYYGPYVYKDNGNIITTWDYSNDKYNYFQYDWYKDGLKAIGTVVWSEPYTDAVTGIPMITSSSAIVKNGVSVGVTTTDIGLASMRDAVSKIKVGQTGYAFIITKEGYYLAHKVDEKNLKIKITDEKDEDLKNLGTAIVTQDKSGVAETRIDDKSQYAVYAPIGNTGMKLVMFMPTSETSSGFNLTEVTVKNMIMFIVAMVVVAILLSLLINRKIVRPLGLIMKETERIAAGDLKVSLDNFKTKDEIGAMAKAVNNMVDNLRQMINQINSTSQSVAMASDQLSSNSEEAARATMHVTEAIQQVAKGSTEQAGEVTDAVQIVNQVAQAIEQIAAGAQDQNRNVVETTNMVNDMVTKIDAMVEGMDTVRKISEQNGNVAVDGGSAVTRTINGMLQVKDAVFETSQKINELGEQSQKIGEIIQVIDDIAEQTNLLALNAAIEAARAGEHGKGFAVVADEVRKLAERSGKATKEIAQLITDIQKGTELAVESMEVGTKEVEEGVTIAQGAGESLNEIVNGVKIAEENVNKIMNLINEVLSSSRQAATAVNSVAAITEENTAATEQMSASTEQVTGSMQNIAAVSEENASSAEEVSASTEELTASIQEMSNSSGQLAKMAEQLQNLVAQFKV